jgi:putative ABC transport system permease protein
VIEALAVLLFRLATLAMPASVRAAWGKEMTAAFRATWRRRPGVRFALRASADAVRAGMAERWRLKQARAGLFPATRRPHMKTLWQDLKYGARTLLRNPGFTAVAVLTLGLGIGANTAIFTVVNSVLLRPLPYREPGRLVILWETTQELPQILVSYPNFLDWRGRVRSFDDAAIYNGYHQFTVTGKDAAERVRGGLASANLFDVLGVRPAIGRGFLPDDDKVGAPPVALLSDAYWKRTFGADPGVLGQTITLDGTSHTIVGVLPPRVRLTQSEIWIPIGLFANTEQFQERANHPGTIGLARLKPAVTLAQMQSDLDGLYRQLRADHPAENAGISAAGDWIANIVLGRIRPALYVLAGAVGLVLLICCVNVANLLLGRAAGRQRELALRVAIGARRERIVAQLLTESVLLSLVGGALGVALAWAGVQVLLTLQPGNIPRLVEIRLDAPVLGFALLLSLVTGVSFGLVPALQSAGGNLVGVLRDGGRGATSGRHSLRMRSTLMVAEVALALMLLVGAGLLIRSFQKLTSVDLGVDPRNVLVGMVSLPTQAYPKDEQRQALFTGLLERVRTIPQVTDAALSSDLPVNSSWQTGVTFEALPAVAPGSEPLLNAVIATPEWFGTLRMRVIAGRVFGTTDVQHAPPVMVISRSVAKRFFGDKSALGQRVRMGPPSAPWITIVGVVDDVRDTGMSVESRGTMYLPLAQAPASTMWLAVRTAPGAVAVGAALRKAVEAINKDLPLAYLGTLDDRVSGEVAQPRFSMLMLGIFAGIALLLAAIGIYGVISYSVAQRTHELGVRIALGANRMSVVGMVVRQVLTMTGLGIAIGGVAALLAGSVLAKLLFGVRSSDPVTFVAVALVLTAVALVAAAVPAWRAARLDPVTALRAE